MQMKWERKNLLINVDSILQRFHIHFSIVAACKQRGLKDKNTFTISQTFLYLNLSLTKNVKCMATLLMRMMII